MKNIALTIILSLSLAILSCGDSLVDVSPFDGSTVLPFAQNSSTIAGGLSVTGTNPLNTAVNVVLQPSITATFSSEVRCSTVTGASFTVTNAGVPVAGTVVCTGTTAVFTPSSLLATNTLYTATVTTAVRDLAGNPLAASHVWTFTTTATPGGPQVSLANPGGGAVNVALNTPLTITFNEEVKCSTVTAASITLNNGAPVAGTVTCSGLTATFTPSALLNTSTLHTATVTTAVQNLAGVPMAANHAWTFTTTATPGGPQVSLTSPTNDATGVAVGSPITITFNEEVKCSTVTAASITLNNGAPVAGTVTCGGLTATFTPSANLALNTLHTATVTTAVQNLAGVPLAANHVWTFTTETGPTLAQKLRGIWVIGGAANIAGTTIVRELDLYDPVTNAWFADVAATAVGPYTPTAFNTAAYYNGKIYVIGGARDNTNPPVDWVYEYDIAANTWTAKMNMTAVRMSSAGYINGAYIYLLAGTATNVTGGGVTTHLRYDIAGNSWLTLTTTPAAPVTTARVGFGCYNFFDDFVFAGGKTTAGASQQTNDIFMVQTTTYTTQTERLLTTARSFMASSGYAGSNGTYLFLAGGANTTTPATAFFNFTAISYAPYASSFIVYLPPETAATGVLTGNPHPSFVNLDLTKGVAFNAGAVSPYNGSTTVDPTFYVFGGIKNMNTVTTDVHAISANGTVSGANYITAGWSAKTVMPRARFGHSVVVAAP